MIENTEFGFMNLFKAQLSGQEELLRLYRNNLILDFAAAGDSGDEKAFKELISQFPGCQRGLLLHFLDEIAGWAAKRMKQEIKTARKNVLKIIALMLTGKCNMDCPICYVDRKKSSGEIGWEETEDILKQARHMGAKTIYTAGIGEPTLDDRFWRIAEYARANGAEWIFFTNGLAIDEKFAKKLADYPVNVWVKFWSNTPEKFFDMARPQMGLGEFRKHLIETDFRGKKIRIPRALGLLMNALPSERLGVQTVPTGINFADVMEVIIPFALEHNLRTYVEPIIHAGRYAGHDYLDLTPEQEALVQRYYVRQSCTRRIYMAVIDDEGLLRPAQGVGLKESRLLGIEREDLRVVRKDRSARPLEDLRFRHPRHRAKLVDMRWRAGCLCDRFAGDREYRRKLRVMR